MKKKVVCPLCDGLEIMDDGSGRYITCPCGCHSSVYTDTGGKPFRIIVTHEKKK
jgi:hypothetical protein